MYVYYEVTMLLLALAGTVTHRTTHRMQIESAAHPLAMSYAVAFCRHPCALCTARGVQHMYGCAVCLRTISPHIACDTLALTNTYAMSATSPLFAAKYDEPPRAALKAREPFFFPLHSFFPLIGILLGALSCQSNHVTNVSFTQPTTVAEGIHTEGGRCSTPCASYIFVPINARMCSICLTTQRFFPLG